MRMSHLSTRAMIAVVSIFALGASFAIGRLTVPEDHRFDVNLNDPLVRKASLMLAGVDDSNIDQLPRHRNQFIVTSRNVQCVAFFPKVGVGEQNTFCFDTYTGGYLGDIGAKYGSSGGTIPPNNP